jgi:dTDP-4-dehydrorhamnose 3,5-epimerase
VQAIPLEIADVVLVEPVVHRDDRGFFFESWNRRDLAAAIGYDIEFVQDNHSRSGRGVLRGLHYQSPAQPQGKLVRVSVGSVWDVAVDIRASSATFKQWVAAYLTADNQKQLWIPPGFAHGFVVLSDTADLLYKASGYYSPEHDRSIRWDDPDIGITWPIDFEPLVSAKDGKAPYLRDADVFP